MNPSFTSILCVRLFLLFIFITTITRTNRYFAGWVCLIVLLLQKHNCVLTFCSPLHFSAESAPNEQHKPSTESKDEKSIEKQLAELSSHLLPADYNRDIRPGYGSGRPVKMAVSIAINDISSISEAAMVCSAFCSVVIQKSPTRLYFSRRTSKWTSTFATTGRMIDWPLPPKYRCQQPATTGAK